MPIAGAKKMDQTILWSVSHDTAKSTRSRGSACPFIWHDNLTAAILIIVNSRKLIHALLIVALCYGQLVANVHLVGHLHAPDCEGISHTISPDCSITQSSGGTHSGDHHDHAGHAHQSITYRHIAHTGPVHRPNQIEKETKTDSDCAIYHALLNHEGTEHHQQTKCITPRVANLANYAIVEFASESRRTAHIRAPPLHT